MALEKWHCPLQCPPPLPHPDLHRHLPQDLGQTVWLTLRHHLVGVLVLRVARASAMVRIYLSIYLSIYVFLYRKLFVDSNKHRASSLTQLLPHMHAYPTELLKHFTPPAISHWQWGCLSHLMLTEHHITAYQGRSRSTGMTPRPCFEQCSA